MLRHKGKIWLALPREVDRWWRNRTQMRIVRKCGQWKIEGPDFQRAQLAYARIRGDEFEYSWTAADGPQRSAASRRQPWSALVPAVLALRRPRTFLHFLSERIENSPGTRVFCVLNPFPVSLTTVS
jgi:hypothetical protein